MAHVLLVDDEKGIRHSVGLFLTRDGHQVQSAADAREALRLLEDEPFDLVVTDIFLPQESGVSLLQKIRERWPDMPVIVITGEPELGTLMDSVQAGAFTVLTKPFERAAICQAVRDAYGTIIQGRQGRHYQEVLEEQVAKQTRTLRLFTQRLQRVASVTRDFALAEDAETLATRVLHLFSEILDVTEGCFFAAKGKQLELLACLGSKAQGGTPPPQSPPAPLIARLFREPKPLVIPDVRLDMDFQSGGWSACSCCTEGSFLAFPLQDEVSEISGIIMFRGRQGLPVGQQELDLGAVIVAHASTALKTLRLTETLRRSEGNFRQLIESAVAGISVVRGERFVYVNQRFADMLGYRMDDLIGRDYLDVVAPEDREIVRQRSRRRASGEKVEEHYPVRFLHREGRPVWTDVSASLVTFEGQAAFLGHFNDISERMRMEEQLADSERRFRLLFENSMDGIVFVDTTGRITACNQAFCRMLDRSQENILEQTYTSLTPAHFRAQDRKIIKENLIPNGYSGRFEKELLRLDGSSVPVELDVHLMRDSQGEPLGYWGYVRDITERLRAEQEVRESENHYRQFSDRALTGIVVHRGGTMLYINSCILSMLGYSERDRGRLLGTNIITHIHPDDRPDMEMWFAAWESGIETPDHVQLRLLHRSGEIVWAETLTTTVMHQGRPAVLAHLMDITARKKALEDLRQSERRFAHVIEGAPLGLLIAAPDGRVEYLNQPFRETYGYTADATPTLDAFLLAAFPDEARRARLRELIAARRGSPPAGDAPEWPIRCADDAPRYAEIFATALGEQTAVWFKDATERVRSEQERALLETQLLHAQKMEAVGRLAGGIAHDFNNLLTGISGNIQLSMMEIDRKGEVYARLENTAAAVARTGELTRQLLAFSRKQTISPRRMDPNVVLHTLDAMLRHLIGEDIRLGFSLDPSPWDVEIDPAQIEQAVMNLVLNARDALPGGGEITLSTRNVRVRDSDRIAATGLSAGDYVILEVRDTGEGIDASLMGHIFEPFFTTKPAGKGTGLGLSMVYGIVKQHRGAVDVTSCPGLGSTFTLYFPRSTSGVLEVPACVSEGEVIRKGHETILVVEDEPMVRSIAVQMLKRLGYRILEAENGRVALEVAEEHEGVIDLMLTDVVMPEMNGREVADAFRARRPAMRVLFTSGYTDEVIGDHGILNRGVEFIPKPYSFKQLASRVRQILDDTV